MGSSVVIGPVRLSYANVWEPKAPKGSTKLVYSSQLVFDLNDTETKRIVDEAIEDAKKDGKALLDGVKPNKLRTPLYVGLEEYPGEAYYKDKFYLNASNTKQPQIVKKVKGKTVDIIDEEEIYSGVWAYVYVNFFAYNNVGQGIGCSLQHILKAKDDERLDNRISAETAFANVNFDTDEETPSGTPAKKTTAAVPAGPKAAPPVMDAFADDDDDEDGDDAFA